MARRRDQLWISERNPKESAGAIIAKGTIKRGTKIMQR